MEKREKLATRLGFIFLSAGCAIGLGNVWRFPYITGQYGGAAFVLIYLFFLFILGLPIMVMEFSVGRASRKSVAASFQVLQPKGSKWHRFSYLAMIGNYLLVMFYTTLSGWMLAYLFKMANGTFQGLTTAQIKQQFIDLSTNSYMSVFWMILVVVIGCTICGLGLQKGVEKVTKVMMGCLLAVMLLLVFKALTLDGAMEGLAFYLIPDMSKIQEAGILNVVYAALGQSFFTLSVGMGGMAIFGSYIDKKHTLLGESIRIVLLDTFVAVTSGFIIFPACFSQGVDAGAGPSLVFETLPTIFNQMLGGRIWGTLFFVFMVFAALSTIIAVFENIVSFGIDLFSWDRKKAVKVNVIIISLLSIPCALGSGLLSGIQPFGAGSTILDFEDFLVSNVIMPIGSLVYLFFCTRRYGWGFQNFLQEANTGKGVRLSKKLFFYLAYILPIIIGIVFVFGLIEKLF